MDVDDERSGCDGEAFSMPAGEGSETDHSEGSSKRQKEKERGGEGAKRKIKQRPIKLARLRVDAHIRVRPSSKEIQLRGGRIRAASVLGGGIASRGPCETDDVTRAEFRRLGSLDGQGGRTESGEKIK